MSIFSKISAAAAAALTVAGTAQAALPAHVETLVTDINGDGTSSGLVGSMTDIGTAVGYVAIGITVIFFVVKMLRKA
jgi:predicted secreted Zn-dependent protease